MPRGKQAKTNRPRGVDVICELYRYTAQVTKKENNRDQTSSTSSGSKH